MKAVLTATFVALVGAMPGEAASSAPWLLYTSDWAAPSQVYGVRPTDGKQHVAAFTFGRPPACAEDACGYDLSGPSPDGRYLLFSDWATCSSSSHAPSLYLARADGSRRRRLVREVRNCSGIVGAVWSSDSRRIATVIDRHVRVLGLNGKTQMTMFGSEPSWQPRGKSLAWTTTSSNGNQGTLWVTSSRRGRVVASLVDEFAWSPSGRWIAYTTRLPNFASYERDLVVVAPDGSRRRTLLHGEFALSSPIWSGDSRYLTISTLDDTMVIDVATAAQRSLEFRDRPTFRPTGHKAAFFERDGIYLVDVWTGEKQLLTRDIGDSYGPSWSPDGTTLAYVAVSGPTWFRSRDLKLVTLSGIVKTLVRSGGDFGGSIYSLTWMRPAAGSHFRSAPARKGPALTPNELHSPWSVTSIAADGGRVAYASCGHVFVWTPASMQVVQAEPIASMYPNCPTPNNYVPFRIHTLALAGDRVGWGFVSGNSGQVWAIAEAEIGAEGDVTQLGEELLANGCGVGPGGLGDLTGSGSLLVFSTWRDDLHCPARTLEQQLYRADPGGCPCAQIASAPGPLPPFDVDQGRIVAGGENATEILDRDGHVLVSVPVSPLAAQLSGSHLVVLSHQGSLQDYDAETGALVHSWKLPDVSSGGECGSPHSGSWECHWDAHLFLEDAARGLATYVLDGQVHLLRLATGNDVTFRPGTLARFTADGLVYIDGNSIHLTPFTALPLPAS